MGEAELQETCAGAVFEDAAMHSLLERSYQRRLTLWSLPGARRRAHRLQGVEREVAPEHCRNSQDLVCLPTEAVEAFANHVAEPLRDRLRTRQRAGRSSGISFVQEAFLLKIAQELTHE